MTDDKRSESQFGPREQREETWGSQSYGMSKAGMTPSDVASELAKRESEHESDKKNLESSTPVDNISNDGGWKSSGTRFTPTNREYYAEGTPFGPAVGPSERRRRRAEGNKTNEDIKKSGGFPEEK